MNKTTIGTGLVTVMLLTVMAEVAANDYVAMVSTPDTGFYNDLPSARLTADVLSYDKKEDSAKEGADTSKEEEIKVIEVAEKLPRSSALTHDAMREAGFFDPKIKTSIPVSRLFGVVPFDDRWSSTLLQLQLFEGDQNIGIAQEFKVETSIDALDLYTHLRGEGMKTEDFSLNETNTVGDNSFYLNHIGRKDQVFLVVRKGISLWAFTYPGAMHDKFKELIEKNL